MALPGYNLKLFRDTEGNPIPFRNLTRKQQREIGYGSGLRKGMHLVANHKSIGAKNSDIQRMFSEKMRSGQVASILPYDSIDELNEIGKGVLTYSKQGEFEKNNSLINVIPAEYEHLYNQAMTNIPQEEEVEEMIDELSGFKLVSTKDIHGNILSQKRVALPLSTEEQRRRDNLLSTINSTMDRMNTLLTEDPDFNIEEPIAEFGNFVNNITGRTSNLFNRLFENAGIHNFSDKINAFKNNYADKFENEMRLAKEKGKEELLNKGYGEESTAYKDYVARMDANLARGKTDIARLSELKGEKLLDNQIQRDLNIYGSQLEKDRFDINAKSHLLSNKLAQEKSKLDNRFNELGALQNIYGQASDNYNQLMNRFNTSQQTLGSHLLQQRQAYDRLNMHRDQIDVANRQNENVRYGIDKKYQANLDNIALQKHLGRKDRVSSFKTGLQALGFKALGTAMGLNMGRN